MSFIFGLWPDSLYKIFPYRRNQNKLRWDGIYYYSCSSKYSPAELMTSDATALNSYGHTEHDIKACDFMVMDTHHCENGVERPVSFQCTYFRIKSFNVMDGLFQILKGFCKEGTGYEKGQDTSTNKCEKILSTNKSMKEAFGVLPSYEMLQECGLVLMVHNCSPDIKVNIDPKALILSLLSDLSFKRYETEATITDCASRITNKLTVIKSDDVSLKRCLGLIHNKMIFRRSVGRVSPQQVLKKPQELFLLPAVAESDERERGRMRRSTFVEVEINGDEELSISPENDEDKDGETTEDALDDYYWS